MIRNISKFVCLMVIVCFTVANLTISYAQAAMVGTETLVRSVRTDNPRARLNAFLDRQEVVEAFAQQGISIEQAKKRVASLTDVEIAKINRTLDKLPAGGDGLGAVIGAAVLIFFVLLITDLLGLTHVFPFVNHPRK